MAADFKNISGKELVNSLQFTFLDASQADVTLVCGGKEIKAHRSVLSVVSPFLGGMLDASSCCSDTTIILDGFEYEVVCKLLMLLYSGNSKCTENELLKMPSCVKQLGIKSLENLTISLEKQLVAESQLASLEEEIILSESETDSNDGDCVEIVYVSRDSTPSSKEEKAEVNSTSPGEPPRKKSRKKKEKEKTVDSNDSVSSAQVTNTPTPASAPTSAAPKIIRCCICLEEFPTKYRLVKHRKTHQQSASNQNGAPLKCAICDKPYKTNRGLSQHLREHLSSMTKALATVEGFGTLTSGT